MKYLCRPLEPSFGGALMRNLFECFFSLFLILAFAGQSFARQTQGAPAASGNSASLVPRLIKFSGILLDHQAQPLKGPVGVTFSTLSSRVILRSGWKRKM